MAATVVDGVQADLALPLKNDSLVVDPCPMVSRWARSAKNDRLDLRRATTMNRIRDLLLQAASSLWFLPLVTAVLVGALAPVMVALDHRVDVRHGGTHDLVRQWPVLTGAGVDGARASLATAAGALITVAGVILSGVLVALSIASGQYTSRVLRSFTGNRLHQAALGLILGSFVYSLIVLRTVGSGADGDFVPEVAGAVAMTLTFASVIALLAFVHGVARSVQASELLAGTAADALVSARALFESDKDVRRGECARLGDAPLPDLRTAVLGTKSGYLREVDGLGLAQIAQDLDTVIVVERVVGDFVHTGEPVVSVAGAGDDLDDECVRRLLACLRIGTFRTAEQDPAFGVRQLVDIALRALSPGINDPTTAEMAVHRIVEVLRVPARSPGRPSEVWREGELRVVAPRRDFASLLDLALSQLIVVAKESPRVLAAIAEGLAVLRRAAARADEPRASVDALEDFGRRVRPFFEERDWPAVLDHQKERIDRAFDTLLLGDRDGSVRGRAAAAVARGDAGDD